MTDEEYTGTAFCVKCKAKRDFTGPIELSVTGKRVTRLARGICPVCGTKVTRILPKAQATA